jgi:hypothetical protein
LRSIHPGDDPCCGNLDIGGDSPHMAEIPYHRRTRLICGTIAAILVAAVSVAFEASAFADCDSLGACSREQLATDSRTRPANMHDVLRTSAGRRYTGAVLTTDDYKLFGGIGAVVCEYELERRAATAFLVGRFDIAVTVASVFEFRDRVAEPNECFYANAGPFGQIRERIAIGTIKTQWRLHPETRGWPQSDLAVVRLTAPVEQALRTLSLTRFAHASAPAILVGYGRDVAADAIKRKVHGRVYQHAANGCVRFWHDIDARNVTPGAPVIDPRDNVVIGIHTRVRPRSHGRAGCTASGNAMLTMTEWLEQTLRAEIGAGTGTAGDSE